MDYGQVNAPLAALVTNLGSVPPMEMCLFTKVPIRQPRGGALQSRVGSVFERLSVLPWLAFHERTWSQRCLRGLAGCAPPGGQEDRVLGWPGNADDELGDERNSGATLGIHCVFEIQIDWKFITSVRTDF